ncbi:MAG: hypothetical protein GQ475_08145 [Methylococcaceae bacterium]|nr:hypothetical protein [Methylococcaceae bacterium]
MKQKIFFLTLVAFSSQAYADYRDDIGYTQLQTALGVAIPNGNGVAVTQVEAAIGATNTNVGAWIPDVSATQFSSKSILDQSLPVSNGISSHATGVGGLFYGNTSSMAPGVSDVNVYSASDWLINGFLKTASSSQPLVSDSRVANHSWIGSMNTNENSVRVLKRVDWLVEEDEFIQVTAMNNGSSNRPLLGSAFNTIAVGRTDSNHAQGSLALDSVYNAGRTRPDVVAPVGATSSATPIVSAAVVMLIDQAHTAAQGAASVISNGDSIYNGERSEVVKAVMMAGADRMTQNTATGAQIMDYRADSGNQADNGLDRRFGAGQLNVNSNYQIMAAGEQDSIQDGGSAIVDALGYDYDADFGGAQSSNNSASYLFDTTQTGNLQLTASLVWNLDIEDTPGIGFNPDATLYNLDLLLFDVTDEGESLLASSMSDIDNTENLWYFLESGRDYRLQVQVADGSVFNWDYGLAWQVSAVPVPAAAWFFISGLLGLFGAKRSARK